MVIYFRFFGIVFLCILILLLSLYFSKSSKIKRELRKLSKKPVSEFKSGEIGKVAGKLEFCVGKSLIAPLSGRKCAYYQVIVEECMPSDNGSHWYTIIDDENAFDFIINQGKDKVLIRVDDYKGYLVKDRNYSSSFLKDANGKLKRYLKRFGQNSESILGFNKTIRYKEGVLEEGEMVAVKGTAYWEEKIENLNKTKIKKYLTLKGNPEKLVISDDPRTLN